MTWDLFWDRVPIDYDAWDTHTRNFPILRENKLPGLDQTNQTGVRRRQEPYVDARM